MDSTVEEFLLKDLLGEYRDYVRDFQTLEKTLFCQKYKDAIETLFYVEGFIENSAIDDRDLFLMFALKHRIVAGVDWSGEEEEGEVINNITAMLAWQGIANFEWKNENLYQEIQEEHTRYGGFLSALFAHLSKKLEAIGYKIAFVDTGSDQYYYFAIPKEQYEKIKDEAYIFDTNTHELYLLPDNQKNMKLTLFLKSTFGIKSSDAMELMKQEKIRIGTGQRNVMNKKAREIAELGGKTIIVEQI